MSSDPFLDMMEAAGFEVKDSGEIEDVTVEYTGVTITYYTEANLPVTVRIEFPVGQAMDAARAAVLAGSADGIRNLLAGALLQDDESVSGYLDANGIDATAYVEEAFAETGPEAPPLSDADAFFTLDK